MTPEARRAYGRKHAQRQRDRKLAEKMRGATRCPKRHGRGVCGGALETRIGRLGETMIVCVWCERQRAGICRHCSRPVAGQRPRALYCSGHKKEVTLQQARASEERHHEERRRKARERYAADVERRARYLRNKALWRKANPEKVRAQKRRYVEKHKGDKSSAYMRYHARYRRKFAAHRRDLVHRLNAKTRRPVPRCRKCGGSTRWTPVPGHATKPWEKCAKCCWPFELKRRRAVRRKLLRTAAREFGQKPKQIRRPLHSPPRGPGDERICITPGCDIVVTHRKKKCSRCRERDARLAAQELAKSAGPGRRTDLERRSAA